MLQQDISICWSVLRQHCFSVSRVRIYTYIYFILYTFLLWIYYFFTIKRHELIGKENIQYCSIDVSIGFMRNVIWCKLIYKSLSATSCRSLYIFIWVSWRHILGFRYSATRVLKFYDLMYGGSRSINYFN